MHSDKTSKKFRHNGDLKYGDLKILWKEIAGGEIVFKIPGEDDKAAYSKLSTLTKYLTTQPAEILLQGRPPTREDVELAIVNPLLAHYRPHAMPDENKYYAASAGVTENGKLFIAVNNEIVIKHAFAGRGCAETTMLRKCQEALGKPEVELASVYLMSGMAARATNGKLIDKKPGHVSCLCGECRQNLRSHTQQARFVMVPSNDGTLPLKLNDTTEFSQLAPGHAWEIAPQTLYPLAETRELSNGKAKMVMEGYAYITNPDAATIPLALGLPDDPSALTPEQYRLLRGTLEKPSMAIRGLNGKTGTLENINRALLSYVKDAYEHHADKAPVRNLEIIAVIVKTDAGEYYPSVLVNGKLWLPSKPPELPTALSNAYNQKGIAEVTVMPFDDHALQTERANMQDNNDATHTVKLPDPAGLGRLLKNMQLGDDTVVRIMPPNNGRLSETQLKELSEPLIHARRDFGPAFANPKESLAKKVEHGRLSGGEIAK